jgi:hypothetical protein
LYNFENLAIVAVKSDIVNFIHGKSIKVTSGLNLIRIKKSPDGADMQKNQKQILKLLYLHY